MEKNSPPFPCFFHAEIRISLSPTIIVPVRSGCVSFSLRSFLNNEPWFGLCVYDIIYRLRVISAIDRLVSSDSRFKSFNCIRFGFFTHRCAVILVTFIRSAKRVFVPKWSRIMFSS